MRWPLSSFTALSFYEGSKAGWAHPHVWLWPVSCARAHCCRSPGSILPETQHISDWVMEVYLSWQKEELDSDFKWSSEMVLTVLFFLLVNCSRMSKEEWFAGIQTGGLHIETHQSPHSAVNTLNNVLFFMVKDVYTPMNRRGCYNKDHLLVLLG